MLAKQCNIFVTLGKGGRAGGRQMPNPDRFVHKIMQCNGLWHEDIVWRVTRMAHNSAATEACLPARPHEFLSGSQRQRFVEEASQILTGGGRLPRLGVAESLNCVDCFHKFRRPNECRATRRSRFKLTTSWVTVHRPEDRGMEPPMNADKRGRFSASIAAIICVNPRFFRPQRERRPLTAATL